MALQSNGSAGAESRPRVVVVGGGFAGLNAARALADAPVRVTLVDRRNHHLFQALLYQVATAGLAATDIASPIRSVLSKQANLDVRLAEVTGVDVAGRAILLGGERLPYDYLILAAGADQSYFGHDEWAPFAPGLKSLEDALEIRRRVLRAFELAEQTRDPAERQALLTFVVVGGGPTGVELAGALAELRRFTLARDFDQIDSREARIILVDRGDRVLSTFPSRLSGHAQRGLERLGVEVHTNAGVTGLSPDGVTIGEEPIPARTVVWCAGVTASSLGAALGVKLDRTGRATVQPDLSIEGHPEVFVVGDLASLTDPEDPQGRPYPGLAPVAIEQGRWAAANIARSVRGEARLPFRWKNRDMVATIGRNAAVAQIRGVQLWGLPAWSYWALVHIRRIADYRNRALVFMQWSWAYFSYHRGARLLYGGGEAERRTGE